MQKHQYIFQVILVIWNRSRDQLKAEIEQNALRENYDGIKYPWEMAHTGKFYGI